MTEPNQPAEATDYSASPVALEQEEKMTEQNDLPFMYQNISECEFIRWNLDYTMPLVIDAASRISDNTIWKPVAPSFDPAGWILGSLPVHEDWTISFLKKLVFQLPERLKGFRSLPCAESPVIQEDLALLINSAVTTAELVQYCMTFVQEFTPI